MIPDNLPVHDQGCKNNCTAHATAAGIEITLSRILEERVTVDVDDLWEKQKKFGTATEPEGDTAGDPEIIAERYGVKFETETEKKGIVYPTAVKLGKDVFTSTISKSQIEWISQ